MEPLPAVVTTVTPVAQRPNTFRCTFESNAIETFPAGFACRARPGNSDHRSLRGPARPLLFAAVPGGTYSDTSYASDGSKSSCFELRPRVGRSVAVSRSYRYMSRSPAP